MSLKCPIAGLSAVCKKRESCSSPEVAKLAHRKEDTYTKASGLILEFTEGQRCSSVGKGLFSMLEVLGLVSSITERQKKIAR